MARDPALLTRSLLATHRPGALVAVALGQAVRLPRRRSRGYALHAVEQYAAAPGGILPPARPGVAVVEVRGVLEQRAASHMCGESPGYDEITARAVAALGDPSVGAVVLALDSPGGDVPGLAECARRIRAAADAAGKPLLAFVDELAASAGYYLACACDGIYGPPAAHVGSIGELIVHASEARAIDAEGVDVEIIRSPGGKANPNGMEALDDLGRSRLQTIVDRGAAEFIGYVSSRRGIATAAVAALDGALLGADDAIAAGLLDGIGSLEDVIALAGSLAGSETA